MNCNISTNTFNSNNPLINFLFIAIKLSWHMKDDTKIVCSSFGDFNIIRSAISKSLAKVDLKSSQGEDLANAP
jgi:hypothetical protein